MAMNARLPTSLSTFPTITTSTTRFTHFLTTHHELKPFKSNSSNLDNPQFQQQSTNEEDQETLKPYSPSTILPPQITQKDLKKVVLKTASTFAPRASTACKNPAVPRSTLYTVFEIQGFVITMLLVGALALSFNLIFPSNEPDIWRLM